MLISNPKFRHRLSKNQIRLLGFLYKFRFVTSDILAEILGKDRSTVYESFYVLEKQGYIHKIYDSTYRIRQRPAAYCLSSKGVKFLLENENYNPTALCNFYRNKSISEEAIDKYLLRARIFIKLVGFLPNGYLATKHELSKDKHPNPLPEFRFRTEDDNYPDFYVDIWEPFTFNSILRKRIYHYSEESEDSEYKYPYILFIAQNPSTERRLFNFTYENYSDTEFYITQQELLLSSEDDRVWINSDESDEDEYNRVRLTDVKLA